MLAQEVVGVDACLVAVSDLVAGLVPDLLRKLSRVEGSTGLDLVRCGEEDRLCGQLVVNLRGGERPHRHRKSGRSREDQDHDRLKTDDSPPNCLVHRISSLESSLEVLLI